MFNVSTLRIAKLYIRNKEIKRSLPSYEKSEQYSLQNGLIPASTDFYTEYHTIKH